MPVEIKVRDIKTVKFSRDDYQGNFESDLMEQYLLLRSTIKDLQEDRNFHSKLYLGVYASIALAYWVMLKDTSINAPKEVFLMMIGGVGILLGYLWREQSLEYAKALKCRYEILRHIEIHLPASVFLMDSLLRHSDSDDVVVFNDNGILERDLFAKTGKGLMRRVILKLSFLVMALSAIATAYPLWAYAKLLVGQ